MNHCIRITDINSAGNGVGRINGKAVFVPGVLVGEEVAVSMIKEEKSFSIGKLEEMISPSPRRVASPCPYFLDCGGCAFLHMPYPMQCETKENIVRAALSRIAKLDVPVSPIVKSDEQFYYRNKTSFPVGTDAAGFYRAGSKSIVDVRSCHLADPLSIKVLLTLKPWAKQNGVRHIVTRLCGKESMVTVVVSDHSFSKKQELVELLSPLSIDSIYLNYNNTPTVLGKKSEHLSGKKTLTEEILGNRFPVSPTSFLQVNPLQTEKLYKIALSAFELEGKTALDAYCGIGTISLALSRKAKMVYGIELAPSAVADAKQAAKDNGIRNVTFYQDKVESFLPKLLEKQPDIVFLDPPRAGLHRSVIPALSQNGIKKIVYISCSPQTLARDLALFAEQGYRIESVTPVDMFPNTSSIECVAILVK